MPEPGERLDRTLARAEVEGEVRAEYDQAARALLESERDRRVIALVVSGGVALSVVLPLIALVLGLSWRILMWAAGG